MPEPAQNPEPSAAPTPRGQEKRKHARHTVEIVVDVYELGEGGVPVRHWSCTTSDLSRGGIGLSSDRMVHIGRVLLLAMPGAAGGPKKVMCGIVRSASYEAGHGHTLGVEFTAVPDSRPLKSWRRDNGLAEAA
ncbi:MAG: PilZ domain-containing protein [Phycisphaerales bacterium]|nr:PilZ domain-containing protein [Phycisphaerales bacterium]